MYKMVKEGVYLGEVVGADYRYYSYSEGLALKLKVSNLEIQEKEITINVFQGSFNTSIEKVTGFLGTNVESEMVGKLFYLSLEKNKKGYLEIKKLYMLVDRNKLFFDPRNTKVVKRTARKKSYKKVI